MASKTRDEQLITETSLQEYFQTSLSDALQNQKVQAGADTIHYVVGLLTSFSRAEKLFDHTPDGMMIRPLALVYADAVEGKTVDERNRALGIFLPSQIDQMSQPMFEFASIDQSSQCIVTRLIRELFGKGVCFR